MFLIYYRQEDLLPPSTKLILKFHSIREKLENHFNFLIVFQQARQSSNVVFTVVRMK